MTHAERFIYEPSTGVLTWRVGRLRGRSAGSLHRRAAGDRIRVTLPSGRLYAHRIAWEIANGPIPDGMSVDHIDCDATNNRLSNLRLATHAENCRNRRTRKDNACGLKGVSWDGFSWHAQINIGGKNTSAGRYPTKGLAAVAYAKAALRHHGQFARIR